MLELREELYDDRRDLLRQQIDVEVEVLLDDQLNAHAALVVHDRRVAVQQDVDDDLRNLILHVF